MPHEAPIDFAAAPRRGHGRHTESDLLQSLQRRFDPAERARGDAQRVDDEPCAVAGGFCDEVESSWAEHYGVVRSEAMSAVVSNTDALGALAVTVEPGEVRHALREAEARLEGLAVERQKAALQAIEAFHHAQAAYQAWADQSGAKHRHKPWPSLPVTVLGCGGVALVETWTCAQFLDGPPVAGVPAPFVLGLMFAGGSLGIGCVAAVGHMWVSDKRTARRWVGAAGLLAALSLWTALSLFGAHMRASIEAGGGGTGPEIAASWAKSPWAPLITPMALLLAAASAATAAAVWIKVIDYCGVPFFHRGRDEERTSAVTRLNAAEEDHRGEVKGEVASTVAALEGLEAEAWKPANDALRLEREVTLILAQARESERAIDRAHRRQLTAYHNTFRRVRPGVDLSLALSVDPLAEEALADPAALHALVAKLTQAAGAVSAAVAEAKIELRRTEVAHMARVDALYSETRRRGRPGAGLTPSPTHH